MQHHNCLQLLSTCECQLELSGLVCTTATHAQSWHHKAHQDEQHCKTSYACGISRQIKDVHTLMNRNSLISLSSLKAWKTYTNTARSCVLLSAARSTSCQQDSPHACQSSVTLCPPPKASRKQDKGITHSGSHPGMHWRDMPATIACVRRTAAARHRLLCEPTPVSNQRWVTSSCNSYGCMYKCMQPELLTSAIHGATDRTSTRNVPCQI